MMFFAAAALFFFALVWAVYDLCTYKNPFSGKRECFLWD